MFDRHFSSHNSINSLDFPEQQTNDYVLQQYWTSGCIYSYMYWWIDQRVQDAWSDGLEKRFLYRQLFTLPIILVRSSTERSDLRWLFKDTTTIKPHKHQLYGSVNQLITINLWPQTIKPNQLYNLLPLVKAKHTRSSSCHKAFKINKIESTETATTLKLN